VSTTLVDTSGLYAFLDGEDDRYEEAFSWFEGTSASPDERLITHNYVVIEAASLVHRRLGGRAVRLLLEDVVPFLDMVWVDEPVHAAAVSAFLASVRRRPSLVDWVSFEVMRREGVEQAFAFDRDFELQGFRTVP
jgi:predicted nucleic acid-binding protein